MQGFEVAIVGAGASGIVAAISAKRKGNSVILCEKSSRLGRKILISGSGRCNLLNEDLTPKFYNCKASNFIQSVFSQFSKENIKQFFNELGLKIYAEKNRVFPVTNQSASVLRVLELELLRLAVPVELDFEVVKITSAKSGFLIQSKDGRLIQARKVIIAGGGKAYPALGSDGSCYSFARQIGHKIIEPVPNGVALVVKDNICHLLQGQKIFAKASSIINGRIIKEKEGELLFTKYGLSGTAILDVSEGISIALNRNKARDAKVRVDMVPFLGRDELITEFKKRLGKRKIFKQDFLTGILPNKFNKVFQNILAIEDAEKIADFFKGKLFKIEATRGWNEAEFTSGGVDVDEVKPTLESKFKDGIYFCGEILDVRGSRGGYNLAWAWASGFVAGLLS